MNILLNNIGKSYEGKWVFKALDFTAETPEVIAITGSNGSGKSTLLQMISGYLLPSAGKIIFSDEGKNIPAENIYRHLSFASPYMHLEENLTLRDNIWFYKQFKELQYENYNEFCERSNFSVKELQKPIRNFSSGMKQRLKLALALFSKTNIKLFDEPLSNLDEKGIAWFNENFSEHCTDRLVFICSNLQAAELALTNRHINVEDYR